MTTREGGNKMKLPQKIVIFGIHKGARYLLTHDCVSIRKATSNAKAHPKSAKHVKQIYIELCKVAGVVR